MKKILDELNVKYPNCLSEENGLIFVNFAIFDKKIMNFVKK